MFDEYRETLRLLRGKIPSADEIETIRWRKLQVLLQSAYDNVPFYRKLFQDEKLVPSDIRNVSDLSLLPAIGRDRLRDAGPDRISRLVNESDCRAMQTSGSSGRPWRVIRTPVENYLRKAVELRSMIAAGIKPNDSIVTLGPMVSGKATLGGVGLYRTAFLFPSLPVEEQARRLSEMKPDVFWVYPTALRSLLNHVGTLSSIIHPRMIINSAEPMSPDLKQKLLSEHPYEFRNFYGSVECGRISFECPVGEGLHINTDCSILEFEDKAPVAGVGRPVIITNLNSRVSPYIRYRLGDLLELVDHSCSCGSALPLMKAPVGREWDVIHLPGGKMVSPWGCNAILRAAENVLQFRMIQKSIDLLQLQLQLSAVPSAAALDDLRMKLQKLLGESMAIEIEVKDHIENKALKFRAFISELEH
jgi:phenylacetate-CoA ligase